MSANQDMQAEIARRWDKYQPPHHTTEKIKQAIADLRKSTDPEVAAMGAIIDTYVKTMVFMAADFMHINKKAEEIRDSAELKAADKKASQQLENIGYAHHAALLSFLAKKASGRVFSATLDVQSQPHNILVWATHHGLEIEIVPIHIMSASGGAAATLVRHILYFERDADAIFFLSSEWPDAIRAECFKFWGDDTHEMAPFIEGVDPGVFELIDGESVYNENTTDVRYQHDGEKTTSAWVDLQEKILAAMPKRY